MTSRRPWRRPAAAISGWWEWSITKTACEYLFAVGAIGVANRRGFERCYDLMERVLPAAVRGDADADRGGRASGTLMALAAGHHGIGTADRPGRLLPDQAGSARLALAELVEEGEVIPVRVRGLVGASAICTATPGSRGR